MEYPSYTSLNPKRTAVSDPMPAWKTALDVALCILALPVLLLCYMVMLVVTRLVSPGPVFFKQERVGCGGYRFHLLKFRTMKVGSDHSVHQNYFKHTMRTNAPMTKLDASCDHRLIPLGWLLRATGIDELPQILNVLGGDMSIVGPRPCTPHEFEQYTAGERQRVNAMPGLTGLWQVSGKNNTTFDEMIRLDILYANRLSLLLDLKIILLTPWTLAVQVLETHQQRLHLSPRSPRHSALPAPPPERPVATRWPAASGTAVSSGPVYAGSARRREISPTAGV
ncbi:MAG TPA: sugar transferase [Candidatus Didemnitutus sp.]|jgi:lipopolysaccharide/colanic/teichoic acid biosynthesis glycosyltransferase